MRQQRGAAGIVESGEPVPERGLVLGHIGLPGLVPFRDRFRGRAVFQVRRLDRRRRHAAPKLPDSARRAVLEGVEAELVQQRRHGDMRIVRHGIPQRQRAMRGQFADEPVRQRLDGVVFVLLRLGLATDGDDGALHGGRGRFAAFLVSPFGFAASPSAVPALHLRAGQSRDRRKGCRRLDADEHAGAGDLGRIVADGRSSKAASAASISPRRASTSSGSSSASSYSASSLAYSACRASIVACSSAVRSVGVPSSSRR